MASSGSTSKAALKSTPARHWCFFAPRRWSQPGCFCSRARRQARMGWARDRAYWAAILWTMLSCERGGPARSLGPALEEGRCLYFPRFDARDLPAPGPGRGFGVQVKQTSAKRREVPFIAASFGEMLPRLENRVTLDPKRRDAWGIPVLHIDCSHSQAELDRARDQASALRELAEVAGVTLTQIDEAPSRRAAPATNAAPREWAVILQTRYLIPITSAGRRGDST